MGYRQILKWAGLTALTLSSASAQSQMPRPEPPREDSVVIIDFENMATTGLGEGGQARITNQYRGVAFNSPWLMDYSKGIAIPQFARSGTRSIMLCYGVEFCSDTTFVLRFTDPQQRVRIWTGAPRLKEPTTITLTASDINGVTLVTTQALLEPNASPHINTPLEARTDSNRIATVVIVAANAYASDIAVDDIEFARLPLTQQQVPVGTPTSADIHVPYVVGQSLDDARRTLTGVGLNVGMIGEVRISGSIGTVWAQHPDSGALAKPNDLVNLDIIVAPPPPWWDNPWWVVFLAAVLALGGVIAWQMLKPTFVLEPRLVRSGIEQQATTFVEPVPMNLTVQLSMRSGSLRAVTNANYQHEPETEK